VVCPSVSLFGLLFSLVVISIVLGGIRGGFYDGDLSFVVRAYAFLFCLTRALVKLVGGLLVIEIFIFLASSRIRWCLFKK